MLRTAASRDLLVVLDSFGECLNLDVIDRLVLDVVVDLLLILGLHVLDPGYHLLVQVALAVYHLQRPLVVVSN